MKAFCKMLLIYTSLLFILSACSGVNSKADFENIENTQTDMCTLSVCVENTPLSRTINPAVSSFPDSSLLNKFILKGVNLKTETASINFDLSESFADGTKETYCRIPFGNWYLTLDAGIDDAVYYTASKCVDLRKSNEDISFELKAVSVTTALGDGAIHLKCSYEDSAKVAQTCEAGLYDISDGSLKYSLDATLNNDASPYYFETQSNSTFDIEPGRYSFKVRFYNSTDERTRKQVGYWEDVLVITTGIKTEKLDIECGRIICQKPEKPQKFYAYMIQDSEFEDSEGKWFKVRFKWTDSSTNEDSFVITINEYKAKNNGETESNFKAFYKTLTLEDGVTGLKAGSTYCDVVLPQDRFFGATIQAKNFVDVSDSTGTKKDAGNKTDDDGTELKGFSQLICNR